MRCPYPWSSLLLNCDGGISFCCWHYPIGYADGNIDGIWNGRYAQSLRAKWVKGDLRGTPCQKCAGLAQYGSFPYPISDPQTDNTKMNAGEFATGDTKLVSLPVEIQYVPSTMCNLRCIHCYQPTVKKGNGSYVVDSDLMRFFQTLGRFAEKNWYVGGEPFYLKQTYDLIEALGFRRRTSEAVFGTNGQLVESKFDRVRGFRKYTFVISIASLRGGVYEKIHHGASFVKLVSALRFLNGLKHEGMDVKIIRQMVVMRSNFDDLVTIDSDARRFGIDETWVKPVSGAFWRGGILEKENIFALPELLPKNWHDVIVKALLNIESLVAFAHLRHMTDLLHNATKHPKRTGMVNRLQWMAETGFAESTLLLPQRTRERLMQVVNKVRVAL